VLLFGLAGAALILASSWVGHVAREDRKRWLNLPLALVLVPTMAFCWAFAFSMYEPEVPDRRAATGFAWAVLGMGALPVLVFYTVGYLLPRKWILVLVWVVAVVPFALYAFIGWVAVADYVACTEDAHECPL